MVAHSTLTGAELHEPKGVAAASINTVYVADGAGSGAWAKVDADNIDATSIFNTNQFMLNFLYDDIGTAGSRYVPVPCACTLIKVVCAIQDVLTTTDNVFTVRNFAGTSMGTITVTQSGSAAGDIDSLTPGANNTFIADTYVKIDSDGGTANTADAIFTLVFTQTSAVS